MIESEPQTEEHNVPPSLDLTQSPIPATPPVNGKETPTPPTQKIPNMLRRLLPFNEPGNLESTPVVVEGKRVTRSSLNK